LAVAIFLLPELYFFSAIDFFIRNFG